MRNGIHCNGPIIYNNIFDQNERGYVLPALLQKAAHLRLVVAVDVLVTLDVFPDSCGPTRPLDL